MSGRTESGGCMGIESSAGPQGGTVVPGLAGTTEDSERRRGRDRRCAVDAIGLALSPGGPAAASSGVDPNGVLKYGFDLNNEFSNDFAPATEENDCSYTVTSNIYQSMTTPGNTAVGGWRGPELDRLQQQLAPSPFTSGRVSRSRTANPSPRPMSQPA